MTHDLEYYLAYPFRWLAQWAGVDYSGEWRNGCAAHLGWGWALMFTLLSLNPWLCSVVILYPVYREANDSKWFKEWNRKNWADLITFYSGEVVGYLIYVIL